MSDLSIRLLAVAVVLLLVAVALTYLKHQDRAPSRRLGKVDLNPGIYLFTSASCVECELARQLLSERLGDDGFVEYSWEENPETFQVMSVDRVPCSLVVDEAGHGVLWPGQPAEMISSVGP